MIRIVGSKEAIFEKVAKDAFALHPAFQAPLETLGRSVADFLLGPTEESSCANDFDAFRFLLCSAASPVAAPIVSARLHASFVAPLADRLGENASGRAALMTACVLGFTTMRFGLNSLALQQEHIELICRPLAAVLQACISG